MLMWWWWCCFFLLLLLSFIFGVQCVCASAHSLLAELFVQLKLCIRDTNETNEVGKKSEPTIECIPHEKQLTHSQLIHNGMNRAKEFGPRNRWKANKFRCGKYAMGTYAAQRIPWCVCVCVSSTLAKIAATYNQLIHSSLICAVDAADGIIFGWKKKQTSTHTHTHAYTDEIDLHTVRTSNDNTRTSMCHIYVPRANRLKRMQMNDIFVVGRSMWIVFICFLKPKKNLPVKRSLSLCGDYD